MRNSVAKKLAFGLSVLLFSLAFFSVENRFQDAALTPTPSPSPSPSPSAKPSATPTPLPGAQNFHQWGSITVFNGLPSDSVRSIAQTNDGVMWFGTDNGLARFDGRRIQNFSPGDADGSKNILALEYDEKAGALFIGTRAGAFIYLRDKFEPIAGTESYSITSLLLWDSLYLGTDAGVVLRRQLNEDQQSVVEPLFADVIRTSDGAPVAISSLITNGEHLIAGTVGRGVFAVRESGVEQVSGTINTPTANTLLRDREGTLWIGSDAPRNFSGLFAASSGRSPVRIAAPTSKVLSLESNDNGVWAGSERFGLFQFIDSKLKKNFTFENTSGGLRSNTVYKLFTDREGVLWIGTNRGVSRFDQTGALQETVSDIPNSNFVRSLFQSVDGETLYAGSNRSLFRKSGETWETVPAFRDKVVYSINELIEGNANILIAATASGVIDTNGQKIVNGDARSLDTIGGRMYAAIYGRGIFDISGRSPRSVFQNESVTSIFGYVDKLWIGTNGNGLYSYDGTTAKQEVSSDALKSGAIWSLFRSGDSEVVWIGGQHGVFRIQDGRSEQIINADDVRNVYVDGKDVWAATTSRGLIHARHDERLGWLTTSIGFEQGLPSDKAFAILPAKEGLLIGTNRGVVKYATGSVGPKIIPTRVLSQRAHDVTELSGKIDLEYPQNSLLIEVAGQSSRTFPEEFQYAFVLTNAKSEEVARQLSNDPQYAPAELKPGDYTIEAIAFNRDLLASEPLFIRFSVAKAPFPWTATALGILLAIAIIGLVWAIVEHRRIVQRNRELAAARFDLANEAERERRRIARDLHDQTLADLRNLMLLSDKISPDKPEFRAEIESVSSEIRRICEDLSPSVLENVGLIAALEFLLKGTFENSEFRADENLEDKISLHMNAQLQAYRIAQEVLTNIKRHSSADRVEMSVSMMDDNKLSIVINDNGETFEANGRNATGRGIANIRARASLINAKANWSAENGNGNRFSLTVDA